MMWPVIYSQEAIQSSARRGWTAVPGSAQQQSSLHTQQRKTGRRGAWCYSQASHLCWPFRPGLGCVLAPHWFPFPLPSFLHPPLGPSPCWCSGVSATLHTSTFPFSHRNTTVMTLSYRPVSSLNRDRLCSPFLAVLAPGQRGTSFPNIPQRLF